MMVTAEFHCHTCYSRDSLLRVQDLIRICEKKQLDRLVITDHNTIEGAIQARSIDSLRFIAGEEILTQGGELLGIFVQEAVQPGLSPSASIDILHSQGAFISVSHPFDTMRKGRWELPDLLDIVDLVDAIEVFNARALPPQANQQAKAFAREHHLLGTVGSDAHSRGEVGAAILTLPDFKNTASLKLALTHAQQHAISRLPGCIFSRAMLPGEKAIEIEF